MSELTSNINYLQPTNFRIVLDRKEYGNLEFFAQRFDHPAITIDAPVVSYKRIQSISLTGDNISFGDLTIEVICDEDMNSYREMFEWLTELTEKHHNDAEKRIQVDISAIIMSSHNNKVKEFRYIDCIPTFVGPLSFQAGVSEAPVVTFEVTFKIGYFELRD